MKILLTGSAGFIGSAVHREFVHAGHDVIGIDAFLPQAHGTAPAAAALRSHRLDVRSATSWSHLLTGVDLVCHQAAVVGVERSAVELPLYAAHNDLGTAALLAAMAESRVPRMLLASSMVVYGEGRYSCDQHGVQEPGERRRHDLDRGFFEHRCPVCDAPLRWEPVTEDAPLRPRSGYAASKAAQEHYAASWARQTGGEVIALRYHNVYGPGMPRDSSYCGVAAVFRSSLERGDAPRVFEDGEQARDFIHVDDVARANLLAAEREPSGSFTAYNISSGRPITVGEVARAIGADTQPQPVITGEHRAGDVRHVVAAPAAAARDLGFRAVVSPAEGLRDFASAPLREVAV